MHKLFLMGLLLSAQTTFAQKKANVNQDNYHNYYCESFDGLKGTTLKTDWLRLSDAVPVILEEFRKAGYDWLYDRTIYKLKNGQYLSLSAYSRKNNIGFLYIEGHAAIPEKKHRDVLFQKDNSNIEYMSCEYTFSGDINCMKIKSLPANIYILNENCYFFQSSDNPEDNERLITKEDALNMLRLDIQTYLKRAPKPK